MEPLIARLERRDILLQQFREETFDGHKDWEQLEQNVGMVLREPRGEHLRSE
jgi:hypothetical protein